MLGDKLVRAGLLIVGNRAYRIRLVVGVAVGGSEDQHNVVGLGDNAGAQLVAGAQVRLGDLLESQAPGEATAGVSGIRRPELHMVKFASVELVRKRVMAHKVVMANHFTIREC